MNNRYYETKQITKIREKNGELTEHNTEISNEFNTYFTQIGQTLASKITRNE